MGKLAGYRGVTFIYNIYCGSSACAYTDRANLFVQLPGWSYTYTVRDCDVRAAIVVIDAGVYVV